MPHTATTLAELQSVAPTRADALIHGDRRLSSTEIATAGSEIAGGLAARGITRGDRLAFQLGVGADAVILYRACWQLGVVPVAIHPMAGTANITHALDLAQPSATVSEVGFALASAEGTLALDDLAGDPAPAVEISADDDALVLFTSGSTGSPKGVVHTHGSLAYKTSESIEVHDLTTTDVVLMPAPLAHVSGLLHGVLVPGATGAKAVLMPKWDAGAALDLIEEEGVTWMVGPPTFFIAMMDHPSFRSDRCDSLRLLSCGGAGVTPAFTARAGAELGAVVKRAYGSTEAPTITTSHHTDPPERMASTDGRPFGGSEIRVDAGGELYVRGPELARGYLDPAQTETEFVDGWFRTGDLAVIDDGWLTITGRLGDRIIRGGENIDASEVEQHLEAHPAVHQAVAVPQPDERLGERVAAFVIAPAGFDLETCRTWFAERGAARYIAPEHIEVVDTLPTLVSGKVDRAALASLLG